MNKNATNTPSFDYFGDILYDGNDGIYFVAGENSNNSTVRNGVWKYTLSTNTWGQLTTTGSFHSSLLEHAVVFYNNSIYVFGGWQHSGSNNNDLYKLDLSPSSPTWSLVSTSGTPPIARRDPSITMHNSKLIIFGGYTNKLENDVWEIDLALGTPTWNQLHNGSGLAPSARYGSMMESYQNKLIIFSGSGNDQECWEFNLTNTWSQVTLSGIIPPARFWSQHDIVDNKIYLYGGYPNAKMIFTV